MRRFGQAIRIKPEFLDSYKAYHEKVWPEILEKITDCSIKNYSIFHYNGLLFAYFEYHGSDFEADMQRMAEHKKTQEWWSIMEPMQEPLPDRKEGEWWKNLDEVFHAE